MTNDMRTKHGQPFADDTRGSAVRRSAAHNSAAHALHAASGAMARSWPGKPPEYEPPRPYIPIKLVSHSHYGTQSAPAALCTEFARQAAERLFDGKGNLDHNAVRLLMNDAASNPLLPEYHRQSVLATLSRMAQGGELANTLNSICAQPGAALKGPAADMVRATLNLPPEYEHLAATHARKAAAMALLGNLRQMEVGSCFATGPAISMHEGSPETVARDLKSLLETNKLTFSQNGTQIDLPLNKRISTTSLDVELLMRGDGTCYGKALNNNGTTAPYKLHETPGIQGALTALGIPRPMMERTVTNALRQMGMADNTAYRVSHRKIIEHIARSQANPARPGNPLASALNAYAGKEDVRLLRAWEYTMASAAELDYQACRMQEINTAAMFGRRIPGKPGLHSLAEHAGMVSAQLGMDPRFRSLPLPAISTQLFSDIDKVMNDRFILQFDADIDHNTTSADGVSARGGFTLYDRIPRNDPDKWVRIDNPQMFQRALAHALGEAAMHTHVRMQGAPGNVQASQAALQTYVQHLRQHIHTDAFLELTARNMNPELATQAQVNLNQCKHLPWKQARGADPAPIARRYGGQVFSSQNRTGPAQANQVLTHSHGQAGARPPIRPDDAAPVIDFLFNSTRSMEPALAPVMQNHRAKLPVSNSLHAFSLMPHSFQDALRYKHISSQQWINHRLAEPSTRHVNTLRTDPPLQAVIKEMGNAFNLTPAQQNHLYRNIANRVPADPRLGQPYTLEQVHREMVGLYHGAPPQHVKTATASAEAVLSRLAPLPGQVIADTNWSDAKGNPKWMLAVHNPFQNRVELHVADHDGKNRLKLGDDWIAGEWFLSTPLGTSAPRRATGNERR